MANLFESLSTVDMQVKYATAEALNLISKFNKKKKAVSITF
jgi:hypothetical protein